MSRFVIPERKKTKDAGSQLEGLDQGGQSKEEKDPYLVKIAKYVPAEILAGYIAVTGIPLTDLPESSHIWIWGILFVIFLILTPLYLNAISKPEDPVVIQRRVSILAFIVWAYAVGGDDGLFGKDGFAIYYKAIASIILVVFSLISGLIVPEKKP